MTVEPISYPKQASAPPKERDHVAGYAWALLACVLTTGIAVSLRDWLSGANLILLFLMAVVLVTVRYGSRPGVMASVLAVLAFDVFLIPPYLSIFVADPQYLLTLAIMLIVSLIISHLTANLRSQAFLAQKGEHRANELFGLSKELSAALTSEQICDIGERRLCATFEAKCVILVPDDKGTLVSPGHKAHWSVEVAETMLVIARLCYERAGNVAVTTANPVSGGIHYVPLRAPMRTRGVILFMPEEPSSFNAPEQDRLLQTCAAQVALALERVHYVEVAHRAMLDVESEKLRNSLLSAMSHDIRTPLTAIIGLSGALTNDCSMPEFTKQELAGDIHAAAVGMGRMVANLLEMARLQNETVKLNKQWQLLEEVIGTALAQLSAQLASMRIELSVPTSLPLLEFDAVLLERVFYNLLDNASKYGRSGGLVGITVEALSAQVRIVVYDQGPGIEPGSETRIFDKFERSHGPATRTGTGLGLSICRAIVVAHSGAISARRRDGGGTEFVILLPQGCPPRLDEGV